MPVEYFLEYQGKRYDIGTRLKFNYCGRIIEGVIENIFIKVYIRDDEGYLHEYNRRYANWDKIIIEIIEPVYYYGPIYEDKKDKRNCPPSWEVEMGWIYYILVMVVGTLFNARWTIYIFVTIIFFAWKNGFLSQED